MFDKRVVVYRGAGEKARRRCVLSQQNAQVPTRVAELEKGVAGIGNGKKLWIDSKREVCKERVSAFE